MQLSSVFGGGNRQMSKVILIFKSLPYDEAFFCIHATFIKLIGTIAWQAIGFDGMFALEKCYLPI